MGSAFAKKLIGFGVTIIAYDKYKSSLADTFVKQVDYATLLQESDIVSLHLPLTDETTHFVNEKFIAEMNKPFYLINTARGKNVSLAALNEGIKSKKIIGACLDVLEIEKSSFENINLNNHPIMKELS